jgi:hypothetical protein
VVVNAVPPLPPGGSGGGFGDPGARRRRLRDIQDVVSSLREPVQAPDLTRAILERVEAEKPFADERTRRLVWISRLGLAASLAVAAAGVALMHRSAPQWLHLTPQSQPLSDVVATAGDEVVSGLQVFRTRLASAAAARAPVIELAPVAEPPAALAPVPPAYSTTFVVLGQRDAVAGTGLRWADGVEQSPAVVRVPLVLTPAPRAVVDVAGVSSPAMTGGMPTWGRPLSTAPVQLGTLIVAPAASSPNGVPAAGSPVWTRERMVLDRLSPGAGWPDAAEPVVPR